MKHVILILLTILPMATPAFADTYQDCVTNLDQNTGNSNGDYRLSGHELSHICTLPNAESLSNCIIDFDQNTSMTSHEAVAFCQRQTSRSGRECAKNLMTNTGTSNGDSALCADDVIMACARPDRERLSDCIIDFDQNTSLTSHESLNFCLRAPSSSIRECAKNLMSNTGTSSGDISLSSEEVLSVCTRSDRERLSSCVINFDQNTSMNSRQALHACLRGGE